MPKLANLPEYEGSEATDTDHSHYDKSFENNEDNEALSTIKDVDSLV